MVRTPGATERKRFKQYAHTYLHGAFQQSAHFIRARNHFFSYSSKIRPWLFFLACYKVHPDLSPPPPSSVLA